MLGLLLCCSDAFAESSEPAGQIPGQIPGQIRISGVAALPEEVARQAIGPPPQPGENIDEWGKSAAANIVKAYQARGFGYARAWFNARQDPSALWFYVDEGRMRVTFSGIGAVAASLFRLRLDLPAGAFQRERLDRSLDEEKKRLNLLYVHYVIHEIPGEAATIFGDVVPERVLDITVIQRQHVGLTLDISVSATWGVIPQVTYTRGDVVFDGDRLRLQLGMAVPYRRYVFDADPKPQWVHGVVDVSYRFPRFGLRGLQLAPRFDETLSFSHYARSDLKLSQFYLLRSVTIANLVLFLPYLELSLGPGADLAQVALIRMASADLGQPSATPPKDINSARGLIRGSGNLRLGPPWARRDQRPSAYLSVDTCFPIEVRATLSGQSFNILGRHRLIVRGRVVALAGTVPFWDDVELAGDYQRTFFGDRYWVHDTLQIETAYHISFWREWFEAGIFHDLSLFRDRTTQPNAIRVIDSFGPSLHFLILDLYALGIYEGFGFAAGKFSQTLSFTVTTVL